MTRHNQPLTPLQVLLTTMQRRWEADDEAGAAEIARLAAPYMHARRTTAATSGRAAREPDQMTDAELLTALHGDGAGMAFAPEDPDQPA